MKWLTNAPLLYGLVSVQLALIIGLVVGSIFARKKTLIFKLKNMTAFIILMASLMSVVAISIDAMLPALSQIGADLGATHPNQAQFLISVLFVGNDHWSAFIRSAIRCMGAQKKSLYIGLAFYAVGSFICYISHNMDQILIGRFIQGLGIASPYISCMAIIRDKFEGRDMARVMSLVMTIFILVPCIAPTLGQGILLFAGWRAIFLFYIIMIAAMGCLYIL